MLPKVAEIPSSIQQFYDVVGFKPTEAQIPILACMKRLVLVSGGEQAGKV